MSSTNASLPTASPSTASQPNIGRTKQTSKKSAKVTTTNRKLTKYPMLERPPVKPAMTKGGRQRRLGEGPLSGTRRQHKPSKSNEVRRPAQYRPDDDATLLDTYNAQREVNLLLPRAAFGRLIHEITDNISNDLRWEAVAVEALQYAAETHLIRKLSMTGDAAAHAGRTTITRKDMVFLDKLKSKATYGVGVGPDKPEVVVNY